MWTAFILCLRKLVLSSKGFSSLHIGEGPVPHYMRLETRDSNFKGLNLRISSIESRGASLECQLTFERYCTHHKCNFPLAEEQKRQKTFFSHTAGSMGSSAWGILGHVTRSTFTLCLPSAVAWHLFLIGTFSTLFFVTCLSSCYLFLVYQWRRKNSCQNHMPLKG